VIDPVDHPQRQRDQLSPRGRKLDLRERLSTAARAWAQSGRHALVERLRLQPLLPAGALVDQCLAQPHGHAQLQDLRRRDPGLRQLPHRKQPQQVAISAVGLRPPLAPALGCRLRRIGEMSAMPRPLDLLDDESPARRRLERKLHIDTVEPRQPRAHRHASRRTDPAATNLTASDVDDRVRDLPTMHIKRAYDPHRDLPELHGLERPACSNTPVPRGPYHISSL
jgi:hypothetical protein